MNIRKLSTTPNRGDQEPCLKNLSDIEKLSSTLLKKLILQTNKKEDE